MEPKIFISYRREDSEASAGRLYDTMSLKFDPDNIFKDVDSLSLGSNFKEVIETKIHECEIVLAIIGKYFTKIKDEEGISRIFKPEDFVYMELCTAINNDKIVIPVLVDNTDIPKASELPESLQKLTVLNGIKLRHESWHRDTEKLFSEISNIFNTLNQKKTEKQQDEKNSSKRVENINQTGQKETTLFRRQEKRNLGYIILGIIFILIIVFLIWKPLRVNKKPIDYNYINELSKKEKEGEIIWLEDNKGYFFDLRDGHKYKVVKIGRQVWMAENLATTKFNDGQDIPLVEDYKQWDSLETPAYCWYDNDRSTYKNDYGALYNWYSIKTGRISPIGWHVPTDSEWKELTDYLGGESIAGGKLKEARNSHWHAPNVGATNETEFAALPGGRRDDGFHLIGSSGYWWSSTEESNADAWIRLMSNDWKKVDRFYGDKKLGFSVRCIRD